MKKELNWRFSLRKTSGHSVVWERIKKEKSEDIVDAEASKQARKLKHEIPLPVAVRTCPPLFISTT